MALPTLDKTWQHDVNIEVRGGGENGGITRRRAMFELKRALVSMPLSPWTVIGSCDGASFGMDGIDRWLTSADVKFGDTPLDGTTNTSWIVLQQTGLGPKFQLMIHCINYNGFAGGVAEIRISPTAGFGTANGGSTDGGLSNNEPQATDQITLLTGSNSPWLDDEQSTAAQNYVLHVSQSSDGECTRFQMFDLDAIVNRCCVFFEKAKNPLPEWTNPIIYAWNVLSGERFTFGIWNDAANARGLNPNGGAMTMYCTCEGHISAMNPQNLTGQNDLTGDYEFYPMGLQSNQVGARGRHGERFDIWWVPTSMLNGMTVPLTPSPTREFCVFEDILFPWDGTLPVLV